MLLDRRADAIIVGAERRGRLGQHAVAKALLDRKRQGWHGPCPCCRLAAKQAAAAKPLRRLLLSRALVRGSGAYSIHPFSNCTLNLSNVGWIGQHSLHVEANKSGPTKHVGRRIDLQDDQP
jgi:hypothetical protein